MPDRRVFFIFSLCPHEVHSRFSKDCKHFQLTKKYNESRIPFATMYSDAQSICVDSGRFGRGFSVVLAELTHIDCTLEYIIANAIRLLLSSFASRLLSRNLVILFYYYYAIEL